MPIKIDSASRAAWWNRLYDEGRKELRKRNRVALTLLGAILLFEIILPVGVFGAFMLMALSDLKGASLYRVFPQADSLFRAEQAQLRALEAAALFALMVLSKALVAAMVVGSAWTDLASFRKAVRRKQLVPAAAEAEPALYRLASEVAGAMRIDVSRLKIWLSMSPSYLPSVVDRGGIHLLAPVGFAQMAEDDEPSGRAILAHEFAHIVHGDTGLWRRSHALSWALYCVSVPIVLFLLLIAPLNATRSTQALQNPIIGLFSLVGIGILMLAPLLLEYATYRSLVRSRRASEDLADLASAMWMSPGTLAEAIRRYVAPTDDALHRSKQSRIDRLNALTEGEEWSGVDADRAGGGTRKLLATAGAGIAGVIVMVVLLKGFEMKRSGASDSDESSYGRSYTREKVWKVAAYAPDGEEIATAGDAGIVAIWNIGNLEAQPIDTVAKSEDVPGLDFSDRVAGPNFEALAYTSDGSALIAATRRGRTWRWERKQARWRQITAGFKDEPILEGDTVAIAANGAAVAVHRSNGDLGILDVATGSWKSFAGGQIVGLAFAPDGRRFATLGGEGMVRWWSAETGQATALGSAGEGARSLAADANGRRVAVVARDGSVHVFHTDGAPAEIVSLGKESSSSEDVRPLTGLAFAASRPDQLGLLSNGLTLLNLVSKETRKLDLEGSGLWFSPRSLSALTIGGRGAPELTKLGLSWRF